MSPTLQELLRQRDDLEQYMFCKEMSDNFYFSSGRRSVDQRELSELNKRIALIEGGKEHDA